MRHLWLLASLAGPCACTPTGSPSAPLLAPPPASSPVLVPEYTAVFDGLVARIERDHEVAPGYVRDVGHPRRDDLPALRAEMARATDRVAALVALRHLQNSLRDAHCRLDVAGRAPVRVEPAGARYLAGDLARKDYLQHP